MVLSVIHILIGGMINMIGQVGAELITHSAGVIKELLRNTFGENSVKYADAISVILSIIIIMFIIYYVLEAAKHKK